MHLSSGQAVGKRLGSGRVGAVGGPRGHRKRPSAPCPTPGGRVSPEGSGSDLSLESHGQGSVLPSAGRFGTLPAKRPDRRPQHQRLLPTGVGERLSVRRPLLRPSQ